MGRRGKRNSPLALLTAPWVKPVSLLRTDIFAEGIFAPVESDTVPPRLAVVYWAAREAASARPIRMERMSHSLSDGQRPPRAAPATRIFLQLSIKTEL